MTGKKEEFTSMLKSIVGVLDADVYLVNSGIDIQLYRSIFDIVSNRAEKSKCALLILSTPGGDPRAAFKIARLFQNNYEHFYLVVADICKSAGTLLGIGAEKVIFGESGELGPLDVQIGKEGEIIGWRSGLDIQHGVDRISYYTLSMFQRFMLSIIAGSRGNIGFQVASKVACDLVRPFLEKTAEQISPLSLGETARAMAIGEEYGRRLNDKFKNLKSEEALDQFLSGYPDHGFVIDVEEAEHLFKRVEKADKNIRELLALLNSREMCRYPIRGADGNLEPLVCLLNKLYEKEEGANASSVEKEQRNERGSTEQNEEHKAEA